MLQRAISELHGCSSVHLETVHVHEIFLGKSIWQGYVEVFALVGNPRAQRCYAWVKRMGRSERVFAVLETAITKTALDAVKFVHVVANESLINEFSRIAEERQDPPR